MTVEHQHEGYANLINKQRREIEVEDSRSDIVKTFRERDGTFIH